MNEKRAWDIAKLAVVGLLGLFQWHTQEAIAMVSQRLSAIERIMMERGAFK